MRKWPYLVLCIYRIINNTWSTANCSGCKCIHAFQLPSCSEKLDLFCQWNVKMGQLPLLKLCWLFILLHFIHSTLCLFGYQACFPTICSIAHWLLGRYAQLDFAAQWCKQICYLVITHLFWTLAQRDMRRPKLTRFCLLPGLIFGFIFCTVTVVLGAITVNQYEDACEGNHCTNSRFL